MEPPRDNASISLKSAQSGSANVTSPLGRAQRAFLHVAIALAGIAARAASA
jgi:hypothetical protein